MAAQAFREGMRALFAARGEERAVQFDGVWWSWRDLAILGVRLGEQLADAPAGPVALVLRNRPSGVGALLGLLDLGRTTFLISPVQPPAAMSADVARCGVVAVLADADDWSPELAAVSWGVELGSADGALTATRRPGDRAKAALPGVTGPRGAAVVIPTSGTTGPPKRIPLAWGDLPVPRVRPAGAVVINALSSVTITGLSVVLRSLCGGRPLALLERLDIPGWVALVREHRPTYIGLPPAAMRMLLASDIDPSDLSSIQAWPTGSAPVPASLQEEFEARFGIAVLHNYGATEFGGTVSGWTPEEHREWAHRKRGSVGRARPGIALRIVDQESGAVMAVDEIGLLEVRSPSAPQRKNEWIRTNDLARMDADGFLYIQGRIDDVIVRGGFKVQLSEVEEILSAHPAVSAAAAVGLPEARLGQVPAAAVTLVASADAPSEQELKDWVRGQAAPYKVPVLVQVVDALPQTHSYKVNRPALRELLEPLLVAGPRASAAPPEQPSAVGGETG
ncbi:class I adenylate-forming enzyme family protein [Pseudonocardia sp. N23]|uniref:class I adenylate-forming enzyme family protein n=1 Tax=Pseudonocardia sp. N23 TaxID=1987376 RepID=UPI000C036525|nr:fatty acid--CoA ligase family protein [Pseudonocardia sp. N23]GAY10857.1 O-succinylbenzoic acid--CoA ligase [Pseudonocardia sp. N23]